MMRWLVLLVWFISLLSSELIAQDNLKLFAGPVKLHDLYTLSLLHASFAPDIPVICGDDFSFGFALGISNTFNAEGKGYRVDSEEEIFDFYATFGLGRDLEFSISMPLIFRGGGLFDSAIDGWHELVLLPKGRRGKAGTNEYSVVGYNEDGTEFRIAERGFAQGDLKLELKRSMGELAFWDDSALKLLLSLPTSRATFGNDSFDMGLQFLGGNSLGCSVALYWGLGIVFYADDELGNLHFHRWNPSAFSSLEYRVTESLFLSGSLLGQSASVESVEHFRGYAIYCDFALKYVFATSGLFEFAIRENPAPSESTADVTVYFASTWHF